MMAGEGSGDGRMTAAEVDIDGLQARMADGFAAVKEQIGDMRGEMRATFSAVTSQNALAQQQIAELFQRTTGLQQTVAAHGEQLKVHDKALAGQAEERASKRAAAYSRRWQWVGWVVAGIASAADLIRALPHLWGAGAP